MAEGSDKTPRTAEERLAVQRRDQGSAVAALNAFTSDFSEGARHDHEFADVPDAMQALAAAIGDGELRIPRLFVLDSLVKFAARRDDSLRDHDEDLDALLEALVAETGIPEPEIGDAVGTVRGGLTSVAQLDDSRAGSRWAVFTEKTAGALGLTRAEEEKPLCSDVDNVAKGRHRAVGVTVEFRTDTSPGDLRHFCDPTRWHECSAFQQEMRRWEHPEAVHEKQPNGPGWRNDLIETVMVSPVLTLETPLRFTYTIDHGNDPGWVHLDYVLPEETDDIVVDEGALDVRRITRGEQKGRTMVSAKKAILFTDPMLRTWPTIACDTFWTDMVIAAAVGCSDDRETPPTQERIDNGRHAG